jgi:uncharacterized protein (DUF433 family)
MEATTSRITKTPGVCGGDACLRGTRYTIWGLVESQKLGASDTQMLAAHPSLTTQDLQAAWDYYRAHPNEIERALWENEACMIEYDGGELPLEMIRRGHELGFTDDEIRDAFEPPLPPGWQKSIELVSNTA